VNDDEGYLLTDLVWPRWFFSLYAAQVLRFDLLAAHRSVLPVMTKIRDGLGGYLTRSGGIRKRLNAEDRARIRRGSDLAERILKNAGARNIVRTWYVATHPGGTAKINDIVESDLKTELDNLFVCDCPVIPQPWGVPPMLTLPSFGKRLAKHLATIR
jgi:choline dehydrogenase-like flavoprotein